MNDKANEDVPWLKPFSRKFLDESFAIETWADIEPVYQKLNEAQVESVEELESWLLFWSEVRSAVDEFGTARYVAMTRQTDDEEKKNAYLAVVREIEPKLTIAEDRLNKKFMASPARNKLPAEKYGQLDRMVAVSVELHTEKNIPITVRLAELSQQYQEISGALMVMFDDKERTMQQMGVYMRDPDRDLREKAYRATYERRLAEKEKFEKIFDEMVSLRNEYAKNLNLPDYRDYAFKSKLRDYTPSDCETFHEAIEKTAVPLARKINERRKKEMNLVSLKPWDMACDSLGRAPLKPFTKSDELKNGVSAIFHVVDERLGSYFDSIGYSMDLGSRKGKAPGGYQTTYQEKRIPFIFTNAVGLQDDVNTLLHEGGHAFHTIKSRDLDLIWYRHAAMEFSEVASMSMELIGGDRLEPFYSSKEDRQRAKRDHLESMVELFGWVARVDAFQSWIYTNPGHTGEERAQKWLKLSMRFESGIDWSDVPTEARAHQWHRQLHIFEVPFYYVEYAIAQMGALQVYRNYQNSKQEAMDDYLAALAKGGGKNPAQLFEAANIRFDFSESLLRELMDIIKKELDL